MKENRVDWVKVVVHLVCGAVLGAFLGLGLWIFWADMHFAALFIAGSALIAGCLAGLFLDRFWNWLRDHGHWLWPWW